MDIPKRFYKIDSVDNHSSGVAEFKAGGLGVGLAIARSAVEKTITLFFVSIVSFMVIHLAPGEPSQVDPLNPKFTPEILIHERR